MEWLAFLINIFDMIVVCLGVAVFAALGIVAWGNLIGAWDEPWQSEKEE